MNIVLAVLPTCLVMHGGAGRRRTARRQFRSWSRAAGHAVHDGACVPWRAARGVVPSPVMFVAGIAMDIITNGPLGFWALIYLFGVLIARQLPHGLTYIRSRAGCPVCC